MNTEILHRLSYHVVYDDSILGAMEFASKNRFSGIQVAMECPHLSFENLEPDDRAEIRQRREELGIRIALHGPDDVTPLLHPNPCIREGILSYYSDLFEFANDIGAVLATIHIGCPVSYPTDTIPERRLPKADVRYYTEALQENLQSILHLACGKTHICVENYLLEDFVLQVLEKPLSEGELGLCWDIAKTYSKDGSVNEPLYRYLMKNRHAVRQVHLHDIDSGGRSHRVIGTGIIDFRYYLGLLGDSDVWDYCIEVRPREKAVQSLENLREII